MTTHDHIAEFEKFRDAYIAEKPQQLHGKGCIIPYETPQQDGFYPLLIEWFEVKKPKKRENNYGKRTLGSP